MSLIVTGTIGIDTVELPTGEKRADVLGGSCTYFAAAASFFTPVRVVAVAGEDLPSEHERTLRSFENVDLRGLEKRAGSKTFRWGGKYLANMDSRETLFTDLNVLAEEPPAVPQAYRDSAYVFLANTHPMVQLGMLEQLPSARLKVADTMDLWINIAKAELLQLLGRIDGLVLNFDEAELLTGHRNTVSAGRHILDMGPRFVVIKKGEHGCIFVHRDGIAALPAFPAEVVIDPTGAGDTFAGGMMGTLAADGATGHQKDPASFGAVRRALVAGTVIASFNIESFSLERLSSLTTDELHSRIDAFTRMLRIE
ncbi:MAG: PfkB family carbohydrate kinase [Phycisphaerales bacterium]|jgi:sugar/nucleoside kinase (ribokinase family)|nr:PfkB family carbohydrate kinase [Phycisphaerales bacterium]